MVWHLWVEWNVLDCSLCVGEWSRPSLPLSLLCALLYGIFPPVHILPLQYLVPSSLAVISRFSPHFHNITHPYLVFFYFSLPRSFACSLSFIFSYSFSRPSFPFTIYLYVSVCPCSFLHQSQSAFTFFYLFLSLLLLFSFPLINCSSQYIFSVFKCSVHILWMFVSIFLVLCLSFIY